jgi:cytoplasmic iron level regulating protein YaaA (DUF328/UPF0246 family)
MFLLISPSKAQDFSQPVLTDIYTTPELLDHSRVLMHELERLSMEQIATLMDLSEKLATLNHDRFRKFTFPFTESNALQALFAFDGDVYQHLTPERYTAEDFAFAQQHLGILSGLYGLLRPLDLIQPYRLEMKTKLKNPRGKDLYAFWGTTLAAKVAERMRAAGAATLVNLASEEYYKAVDGKLPAGLRVVTPVFKEKRNGGYKIISLFAKQARGMMANYALMHHLTNPEGLKAFREGGYAFSPALSRGDEWVFVRGA